MSGELYRVVEKCIAPGRRQFKTVNGPRYPKIDMARQSARQLGPYTLAHRMFIEAPGAVGMVEEVDLEPLAVRMERVHFGVIERLAPSKLESEQVRQSRRDDLIASWQRRAESKAAPVGAACWSATAD